VAWGYLLTASALEIGWAVGLKYTEGFTRVIPTVLVILGIVASFALVARAAQELPIGTAYGVFVGLGAFGTGIVGIVLLGEPYGIMRMLSLAAIVLGVVGLKVFGEPLENEQSKAGK
jgi:quaternary ammonium compound-resistance protein SugE